MMITRAYFFFIALISFSLVFAQDDDGGSDKVNVRPSRYSVRTEISVPSPVNGAWRKSMVGVFETNLSFNYKVSHDFFIGAGYKGAFFYTPPKFYIFELKTKMKTHSGFLRIGYDLYKTNTYFISPAINSGWTYTRYSNIVCKKNPITWEPEYQSWFIEPQLTFNFLPEPNFGISLNLSFVLVDHVWDPEFICLQDHIDFSEVRTDALTSYINLGFGIYWGFGRGKTIAGK